MSVNIPILSKTAQEIFGGVIAAMQDAEELGGVASTEDYAALMTAIAAEAENRKCNALAALEVA